MLNTTVYFRAGGMKKPHAYKGNDLHKNMMDVQAHLNKHDNTLAIVVRKDDKNVSILARDGVRRDVRVATNNYKTRVYETRRTCPQGFHQCSPTARYKVTTLSQMDGLKRWASRELTRRLCKINLALDELEASAMLLHDSGDVIAQAVGEELLA